LPKFIEYDLTARGRGAFYFSVILLRLGLYLISYLNRDL